MKPFTALSMVLCGAALPFATLSVTGCATEAFCFDDCENAGNNAGVGDAGVPDGDSGGPIINPDSGGPIIDVDGGTEPDPDCDPTANEEVCDDAGNDEDCDGLVNEADTDDVDLTSVRSCGNCATDCTQILSNVRGESIRCVPPDEDGAAGTCEFETCASDFYDVDGDPSNGCEYFCVDNPDGENTEDLGGENCGKDDDCDGVIDEDVDTCQDITNCGRCGRSCVVANGTPRCVSTAGDDEACTTANTSCEVDECDDGFFDVDGSADNGCEYECTPSGDEVCDGVDNDCDGRIDNADEDLSGIGEDCFGGTEGVCANQSNRGVTKCIGATVQCCDRGSNQVEQTENDNLPETGLRNGICRAQNDNVIVNPGDRLEECNGLDDDCDGVPDDTPVDAGAPCGLGIGACRSDVLTCVGGVLECPAAVDPTPEVCNGVDDDCDGVRDGTLEADSEACTDDGSCSGGRVCLNGPAGKVCVTPPTDAGQTCEPPDDAPCVDASGATVDCGEPGATQVDQPCSAGTTACRSGALLCEGALGPTLSQDLCGEDSNCDGFLSNQPDLSSDENNCGACGNRCGTAGDRIGWTCENGSCVSSGCDQNWLDCDGNPDDCEVFCAPTAGTCDNQDNDCDCQVDEADEITNVPSPVAQCGVSQGATDPLCGAGNGTNGIRVRCAGGSWTCDYPPDVCGGASCAATAESCDGIDNNCNGVADEDFSKAVLGTGFLGQPCASDDGLPAPGHGACRTTGEYVCRGNGTGTRCNAAKDNGQAGNEVCDGEDNDCDGFVDEVYDTEGAADDNFVQPAVTQVGSSWVYRFEATRPNASANSPGTGNGYHDATGLPPGTTIDRTLSCSVSGNIPWFNVTPLEAEQTCAAVGGRLCDFGEWVTACEGSAGNCDWGYDPDCTTSHAADTTRSCNLHYFDFDSGTSGDQDGLLPTRSTSLAGCYASFGGNQRLFDITGNLREIAAVGSNDYRLMGGSFTSQAESGATCSFDFFSITEDFRFYDAGFRCCFDQDPRVADPP